MKRIALLGSTGSIGRSALHVIAHSGEEIRVTALAAHSQIDLISNQIRHFQPEIVAIYQEDKAKELKERFPYLKVVSGEEGMEEVAAHASVDFVLMAIVGMQALKPTLAAIEAGKVVGLASKEVLVAAGEYVTGRAREKHVPLLPIDSEHSAVFQCLQAEQLSVRHVRRILLTASGGPFREYTSEQLAAATLEQALNHPTWKMGPKVTIDSSTLMNKGLEMIEARWLFGLPPEKIEAVIHPESIVHSFVEFIDGTLLAQLHEPDMKMPIHYALNYPKRGLSPLPPFDFTRARQLNFYPPDLSRFPALTLSKKVMEMGASAPACLNATNETLVGRFLKRELAWNQIIPLLEKMLEKHTLIPAESLEAILFVDQEARREALTIPV